MIIADLAFYLFSVAIIATSGLAVMARHPVNGALWLIMALINGMGLMVLAKAGVLPLFAMLGHGVAVIVLFGFVLRLLDAQFPVTSGTARPYLPFVTGAGILLLFQLGLYLGLRHHAAQNGGVDLPGAGSLLRGSYFPMLPVVVLIMIAGIAAAVTLTPRAGTSRRRD